MKKMIKWIKDKIIWLIFGSIALASTVAIVPKEEKTVNEKITTELVSYESKIKTDLQDNGKYKQQDEKEIDGVKYRTDEYETSKGEIGYTITLTKEEDGKVYKKAISTGVQKEDREYDWTLIKDNIVIEEPFISSTSTLKTKW